ncbi:MAG: zinc ribbon domain-containing protein [Promethearchaeota archaeon]
MSKFIVRVYYKITINDTCGNNLDIDNNGLTYSYSSGVFAYTKIPNILSPTLYDDWNWSYVFTSGKDHLDKVWVRMEYNGGVYIKETTIEGSGDGNATFSLSIQHNTNYDQAIYKFMYKADTGQTHVIEEIELRIPKISIEELEEPPAVLDLLEDDSLTVEFIIDQSEYIDYMYIEYEFDDGKGKQSSKLTQKETIFSYKFENFPDEATSLTYRVIAVDKFGNEIELGKDREIQLLPEPPNIELTTEEQLLISFIALIVGICSGVVFSTITERKQLIRKIHDRVFRTQKIEKEDTRQVIDKVAKRDPIQKESAEKKILILIGLSASGFAVSAIIAILALVAFQNPVIAIMMFMLSFLLSVVLWIYLSAHSVERHLHSLESKSLMKDQLLLSSISILIYVSLLAIFITGNEIAWWRVRVAQNSINLLGIALPRALMTVTTTFFSSIFLLTWSTFKSVAKRADELRESEALNENPLTIFERKEDAISSVIGNVGKKGIIFIAIIAVVIIFSSDLNVYANQGLMIIIPFVIGAIATLMLISLIKKKKDLPSRSDAIVLDHIIICPHCQQETPLGGNYCEACGGQLLKGQRFSEGLRCTNCQKPNTAGAHHCRHCGAELG